MRRRHKYAVISKAHEAISYSTYCYTPQSINYTTYRTRTLQNLPCLTLKFNFRYNFTLLFVFFRIGSNLDQVIRFVHKQLITVSSLHITSLYVTLFICTRSPPEFPLLVTTFLIVFLKVFS